MLSLFPHLVKDCEGIRRRDFLKIGCLAGLGISLPMALAQKKALAKAGQTSKDVNCILVWTVGGTSHHDTFDPKPDAPESIRGPFGVIDTAIPGVKFTEVCPKFAKEAKRFSVLRSWNPRNGSHGTADAEVMSGRKFNVAMTYPCYGSMVSHQKGFKTAMPPFIQLGERIDGRFGGGVAGYLGMEHNPFQLLSDPNEKAFSVRDITPPTGVDFNRIARRRHMIDAFDKLQLATEIEPEAFKALDEQYETAFNMITAPETKKAFALDDEDSALRDRYGRTPFGQSCLLARRLVESGVRFVTVTNSGGWDHHQNVSSGLKQRMPPVDQGLPELLIDLEERGMLDTTLVLWLTDFGRTPKINAAGGRDHWAGAGFALAAGAGIPGGTIIGRTDGEGGAPVADEYHTEDIGATVYSKLGIPLDLITYAPDGRPVRLNEGGRPIHEWM